MAGLWTLQVSLILPFLFLLLVQQKTFEDRKKLLGGFVAVGALLGTISLAAIGARQIVLYPHYVLGLEATMAKGAIMPSDMPNLRGMLYLMASQLRHFDMLVLSVSAVLFFMAAWSLHWRGDNSNQSKDDGLDEDLKFALAVFATVLVSYHGLGYDLCILALPMLLLVELAKKQSQSSAWIRATVFVGLALLLLSPLQLILLMRYNQLAFLGWAVLFCFVGIYGELRFRAQYGAALVAK